MIAYDGLELLDEIRACALGTRPSHAHPLDRGAIQRAPRKTTALKREPKRALKRAPAALPLRGPPEMHGLPAFASQLALPLDRGAIHDDGCLAPSAVYPPGHALKRKINFFTPHV